MPLTDEVQLGFALEAFAFGHDKPQGWATKLLLNFQSAGITSMSDLLSGCKDTTVNLDLELFGIPPEERLSQHSIEYLVCFLPGPVGIRTFRLAQRAAEKVKRGSADTEYVHRPESGKIGKEEFIISTSQDWTLNVDCAGFVRNCLKHCTKDSWQMRLSDRDFMRAKDFFGFFQTIPYTIMDKQEIPDSEDTRMKWRIVNDLRLVIPGDVIVYRPQGSAAGGAAFTENDAKDLPHLLKAVKMSQLWLDQDGGGGIHTRNVARDPTLKPWVHAVQAKLAAIGITTVKELRTKYDSINDLLKANDYSILYQDTLRLMRECYTTTALNTGHIVFAAGPMVDVGNNEYRVRVVHSTKYGKVDKNGVVTSGVQEHYRRFTMVQDANNGKVRWLRAMKKAAKVEDGTTSDSDDEEDNPNDDMEETEDEESGGAVEEERDEPIEDTGPLLADVMAVRMCF